jgi:hypothetical protein
MELDEPHLDFAQHSAYGIWVAYDVLFSTRIPLEYCIGWRMRDGLRLERVNIEVIICATEACYINRIPA